VNSCEPCSMLSLKRTPTLSVVGITRPRFPEAEDLFKRFLKPSLSVSGEAGTSTRPLLQLSKLNTTLTRQHPQGLLVRVSTQPCRSRQRGVQIWQDFIQFVRLGEVSCYPTPFPSPPLIHPPHRQQRHGKNRRPPQSPLPRRTNPTRHPQGLEAFENNLNRITAKIFMSNPSPHCPPPSRRALYPRESGWKIYPK